MKFSKSVFLASLAGMAIPTTPSEAAPPPPITASDLAELKSAAVTKAPQFEAGAVDLRTRVASDLESSTLASKAAAAFMLVAGLPVTAEEAAPATKPPEPKPGPGDTVINCEGGMYFDPEEGVLVYLKNVTVRDPRFDLSGASELKIYLAKKNATESGNGDSEIPVPEKAKGIGGSFGDPERIIATGAVVIEQKAADGKDPIKASAALFSYNIKQDEIVLSGGYPWFTQGPQALRAKQPNQSVRISPKTGELRTDGGEWQTLLAAPRKNQ